jgi:hypothetical protein
MLYQGYATKIVTTSLRFQLPIILLYISVLTHFCDHVLLGSFWFITSGCQLVNDRERVCCV